MRCGKRFTISAVAMLFCAAPAASAPNTTVERTIFDCNGDNLLELTFGEQHLSYDDAAQREEEAAGDPCSKEFGAGERLRLGPGGSIVNFLQLSDFQIVDEESPA